ncbi:MAG: serine--tRNA ligase [Candidatus Falkowbacteria bacterium]|nr:serine--tRNA ligase [Candidatus Falkowbacteria bacterium]
MLDIKFIRENTDQIKEAAKNKNIKVDIDKLLAIDQERRELLTKIEKLRKKRNEAVEKTKNNKPNASQIEQGRKIKEEIAELEQKYSKLEDVYNNLLWSVPNIVSEDTPVGPDGTANLILRKVGQIPNFAFKPKDHVELGNLHQIIDTEKSALVAGARFNYLFGAAALLQFAIVQYVFHTLTDEDIIKKLAKQVGNPFSKPFMPVIPPVMAKSEVMKKMDRYEPLEDHYYLPEDDCLLIGSAEHTLGPLHMNEILDEKDLPKRYIGYSTAFRREAGSYGKDTIGILRRHQFDKLEMESFIQPEYGLKEQELIIAIQEYLVGQLGIPYQVVLKSTGDIGGKADFRAVDIECYLPGEGQYRETHTSDYMTDFQARRLNTRFKNKAGEKKFVYMNDATAFAIGRTLIAILENYQEADGSINIPQILHQYLPSGMTKIVKK